MISSINRYEWHFGGLHSDGRDSGGIRQSYSFDSAINAFLFILNLDKNMFDPGYDLQQRKGVVCSRATLIDSTTNNQLCSLFYKQQENETPPCICIQLAADTTIFESTTGVCLHMLQVNRTDASLFVLYAKLSFNSPLHQLQGVAALKEDLMEKAASMTRMKGHSIFCDAG